MFLFEYKEFTLLVRGAMHALYRHHDSQYITRINRMGYMPQAITSTQLTLSHIARRAQRSSGVDLSAAHTRSSDVDLSIGLINDVGIRSAWRVDIIIARRRQGGGLASDVDPLVVLGGLPTGRGRITRARGRRRGLRLLVIVGSGSC